MASHSIIKSASRALGVVLVLASLSAVGWFTHNAIELGLFESGVRWPFFIVAGLVQLTGVALLPFFWQEVLRALWSDWRSGGFDRVLLLRAYSRSWLARYIPGRVWMFGGRLLLGRRIGVPSAVLVRSMAFEVLVGNAMLTLLGLVLLLGVFLHPLAGAGLALACFIGWPYLLRAVEAGKGLQGDGAVAGMLRRVSAAVVGEQPVPPWFAQWTFAAYGLRAAFQVGSIVLVAFSFLDLSVAQVGTVAAVWAISSAVAVLLPLAPAGLGVREGVALGLLSPVLGAPAAAAVVAASRVITVAADLAFVALVEIGSLRLKREQGHQRGDLVSKRV